MRAFFLTYTEARILRGRRMTDRINELLAGFGLALDFDKDILPISMAHDSGSVTERHILFALAQKITKKYGKGQNLVSFLRQEMRLPLSEKLEGYLLDSGNPFYEYDLLGVLKSDLVEKIYIDADEECPDVRQVLELSEEIGAISAYAYLGDVGQSVTGDKKTQTFEDSYLDLLFETIHQLGFRAVTYMPSRNTPEQLSRIRTLAEQWGFFQISGEDINTPRQSFICVAQRGDEFAPLRDAALALIGHELEATLDSQRAMFSRATIEKYPDLNERIQYYKGLARVAE